MKEETARNAKDRQALRKIDPELTSRYNSVVWAKLRGYPYWPALVCNPLNVQQKLRNLAMKAPKKACLVYFYDSGDYGSVPWNKLYDWKKAPPSVWKLDAGLVESYGESFNRAVDIATKDSEKPAELRVEWNHPEGLITTLDLDDDQEIVHRKKKELKKKRKKNDEVDTRKNREKDFPRKEAKREHTIKKQNDLPTKDDKGDGPTSEHTLKKRKNHLIKEGRGDERNIIKKRKTDLSSDQVDSIKHRTNEVQKRTKIASTCDLSKFSAKEKPSKKLPPASEKVTKTLSTKELTYRISKKLKSFGENPAAENTSKVLRLLNRLSEMNIPRDVMIGSDLPAAVNIFRKSNDADISQQAKLVRRRLKRQASKDVLVPSSPAFAATPPPTPPVMPLQAQSPLPTQPTTLSTSLPAQPTIPLQAQPTTPLPAQPIMSSPISSANEEDVVLCPRRQRAANLIDFIVKDTDLTKKLEKALNRRFSGNEDLYWVYCRNVTFGLEDNPDRLQTLREKREAFIHDLVYMPLYK